MVGRKLLDAVDERCGDLVEVGAERSLLRRARGQPATVDEHQRAFAAETAKVDAPESYALVGCTVAPGFSFDDFEMPPRTQLLAQFPQHRELIESFTH